MTVVPRVDTVTTGNPHTVRGGPFTGPGIDPDGVRLTVDGRELVAPTGALSAGELQVTDRTRIDFLPPTGLVSGAPVRLRLLVNGAECLPTWYVAP